jgi:glycerate-2-kinase
MELVLGGLEHLGEAGLDEVVILSGGTDGEDGPTPAAGGIADRAVARAAGRHRLEAAGYLDRHDSYTFLARTGGLLRTGPTGTNVMDLRVVLVGRRGGRSKRRGRDRAARPR